MKLLNVTLVILLTLTAGSCELDSNLFNPEELSNYKLPGNTIPDSLLQEISFDSEGNTLYGYWVKSNGRRPDLTILYCHGNKHNLDEYWERVMLLHESGANIFIFDYRGFGKSKGESSQSGLYADGRAALEVVKRRPEYHPDSLCIYGYSLGNVVSIYLSAEITNPLCLIAEAPFASANSLTQGALGVDIPPLWLTEADFDNVEMVKKINSSFLLFHGEDDDFVRYRDNGRLVFNSAPDPKELVLVPHANHTDIPSVYGPLNYINTILNFIEKIP